MPSDKRGILVADVGDEAAVALIRAGAAAVIPTGTDPDEIEWLGVAAARFSSDRASSAGAPDELLRLRHPGAR